jgi:muconolactone delta-isomerase
MSRNPPPSIGDREALSLDYKTIRVRERPPDKYDAMYMARVKAGQLEHKTARELSRHGKRKEAGRPL